MKGDFSRFTSDPAKHYTGVLMQQGRVQLDADWNEQQDIHRHLMTVSLCDALGPGGFVVSEEYLFAWDDVTGKDIERLRRHLRQTLDLEWAEHADIRKSDSDNTIYIKKDGHWAEIVLHEEGKSATLTTRDGRRHVLKVREKDGRQNVYNIVTGFAVTLAGRAGASPGNLPDLWIGSGRCYVDGILCENEAPVLFSQQPDWPDAGRRLRELANHNPVLVYLDVWQRHITVAEDPEIVEVALGGADTTTRTKTVWQAKLLPLLGYDVGANDRRHQGGLRSLTDWQGFVDKASEKGRMKARWAHGEGEVLENHLYRVEIHTVGDGRAMFKWSRENGSVVFPIQLPVKETKECVPEPGEQVSAVSSFSIEPESESMDEKQTGSSIIAFPRIEYVFDWDQVPGRDNRRLLDFLREDLDLQWTENARIETFDDPRTIYVVKDDNWAKIVLKEEEEKAFLKTKDDKKRVFTVREENDIWKAYKSTIPKDLEEKDWIEIWDAGTIEVKLREPDHERFQLREKDWVEIVDDRTVLRGLTLPLAQVKRVDHDGERVILQAGAGDIDRILAETKESTLQHPLLRRWDEDMGPETSATPIAGRLAVCQVLKIGSEESTVELEASPDDVARIRYAQEKQTLRHPRLRRLGKTKPPDAEAAAKTVKTGSWQPLERGIRVLFSEGGNFQVGDYWLFPARTQLAEGLEWPRKNGEPLARPPHGITHHYAPLALLHSREGEWHVEQDVTAPFRSLTELTHLTDDAIDAFKRCKATKETILDMLEHKIYDLERGCKNVNVHVRELKDTTDRLRSDLAEVQESIRELQKPQMWTYWLLLALALVMFIVSVVVCTVILFRPE